MGVIPPAVARTLLTQVTGDANAVSSLGKTISGYVHATEDATDNPDTFASHITNGVINNLTVMTPYLTDSNSSGGGSPSPTFTVAINANTLIFGGTATGDITFTVASDGTATFTRGGVTATTKPNVSDITSAGTSTIKLSANASDLSTASATKLEAITGFDANSHSFTVLDTAANLIAHHNYADATAYKLSANATDLSTTDATALTGITGYNANGHTFTVLDTAANLIAHHGYTDATAYKLLADASDLSTTDATALTDITGYNANGHTFTVLDTAANLIAHHGYTDATAYKLSVDATVSVTQFTNLVAITGFDKNSNTLTVSDHTIDAAALAALNSDAKVDAIDLAGGSITLDQIQLAAATKFDTTLAAQDADTVTVRDSTTVDASSNVVVDNITLIDTDNINATGNGAANIITGNSGNNIITGGAGADTLTGGDGADTFQFALGDSTRASMDTITDYLTGGADVITLTGLVGGPAVAGDTSGFVGTPGSAVVLTDMQFTSGTGSILDDLNVLAAYNQDIQHNAVFVFQNGGDTYIYVDAHEAVNTYTAGDTVIKLTGFPIDAGTDIQELHITNLMA